jgi:peptidylprolyl isomerase
LLKTKFTIALTAAALLLSGCSANGTDVAAFDGVKQTCDKFVGGSAIDSVKVTLADKAIPKVDFVTADAKAGVKSALAGIKSTQSKIIREGSGPAFTGDELTILEYAVFNATTGALLGSSQWNGTDVAAQVFDKTNSGVYCKAISGAKEGSVIAFATPPIEDDPQGSLYVFEIKKVYLPRANGAVLAPASGLPQVVRDPKTGRPGLVQPTFSKPTEFKRAITIEGKGAIVAATDSVTVHYSGWVWSDRLGGTFESSWDSQPATFSLNQTITGFGKALEGVRVGSQVIAVMPPDDAYGADGNGTIAPNSTLLFVIDVLGINK